MSGIQASVARRRSRGIPRHGSIYLVATAGLVLVGGVGLAAMGLLRVDRTTHLQIVEIAELRRYAQSGLELGVQRIIDDQSWRSVVSADVGWTWSVDDVDITVLPMDPIDGDLADDAFDDVVLTAWASRGEARQGARVRLAMHEDGGAYLGFSVVASDFVRLSGDATLVVPEGVYTLTDYYAGSGTTTTGDVMASGAIVVGGGAGMNGASTAAAPVLPLPDPVRAFETWVARATPIDPGDLVDGHRLVGVTLSPSENPFGDVNADGIYHIDNVGATLEIESVSITGTLIITRAHGGVEVISQFDAAPLNPSDPVVMVHGDATFPNSAIRSNINGLALFVGELRIDTDMSFAGPLVVLGILRVDGSTTRVVPSGAVASSPPPGFSTRTVPAIVEGSWRRAAD